MKARVAELSPRARVLVALVAVVVYAAAVWFLAVAPKRSEASSLATEITAAELQLAEARAAVNRPKPVAAPVADVVRLAKAMPSTADQPSLVLELAALARRAGVTLGSIAPEDATVDAAGATRVPVAVTVTGSYPQITRFLRYARELVGVSGGKLHATGRLFSVQGLELSESATGRFPRLDAIVTLHAYAYDGPIVPPTPATPTPSGDESTSGATAAGGTP